MADAHQPHPAQDDTVHHEESDVNIEAILMSAAGLVATTLVLAGLVWGLYRYLDASAARQGQIAFPLATQEEQRLPPEPRLQTNPREDLLEMRAEEHKTLTTYGWVDKNAGVVRIPIEEAMKLTVQRGLAARGQRQ